MQIGQILVEHRWVAPEALAQALTEQRHAGKRICSMLIARGLLAADDASRALANQHNVPGVLQKHLDNRDRALAELLPAELARACVALPIGRTGTGALIICVRDPRPELTGMLSKAVGGPVVIAVSPAHQLEQLIKLTYAGVSTFSRVGEVSYDVDLSTRPIATVRNEELIAQHRPPPAPVAHAAPPAKPARGAQLDEVDVDLHTRQISVIGDGLADLGSMTLVELDDARVTKDPSQSGQHDNLLPRTTTLVPPQSRTTTLASPQGRMTAAPLPPRTTSSPHVRQTGSALPPRAPTNEPVPSRTRTASPAPPRTRTGPPPPRTRTASPAPLPRRARPAAQFPRAGSNGAPRAAPDLTETLSALASVTVIDDATDVAMRYLADRFHYAVLFTISEGAALGDTGYGDQLTEELVHAITVPLSAPSIIQTAHDTGRLVIEAPADAGAIQDRLERTLGNPRAFAAMPIELDATVAFVIAVGDAAVDPSSADDDLERLGRGLGAAYQRLPR